MNEYDYRGYVIVETPEGYYEVEYRDSTYEFTSYDEAADWIDRLCNNAEVDDYEDVAAEPELRNYYISYVPIGASHAYDDFIQAYSREEAIQLLKDREGDIDYVTDCYPID